MINCNDKPSADILSTCGPELRALAGTLPPAGDRAKVRGELARYGLSLGKKNENGRTVDPNNIFIATPATAGVAPTGPVSLNLARMGMDNPVSLFSGVSKMPGSSFSLPAGKPGEGGTCVVAGMNIPNNLCRICYALQGQYLQDTTQRALWVRFQWIDELIKTQGVNAAGRALAIALRWQARTETISRGRTSPRSPAAAKRGQFFRLHDSGAIYSRDYAKAWLGAACLLAYTRSNISIWIPARVWYIDWSKARRRLEAQGLRGKELDVQAARLAAEKGSWLQPLIKLNSLPCVTVRPSAVSHASRESAQPGAVSELAATSNIPPLFPGLSPGSGTWLDPNTSPPASTGTLCPAPKQAGRCFGNVAESRPRPPWKLDKAASASTPGYAVYRHPTRGTKKVWLGGGVECTSCWEGATAIYYKEHGLGTGKTGLSPRLQEQMVQIRRRFKPKGSRATRGRWNWAIFDPRASQLFIRAFDLPTARAHALRNGHLLARIDTGALFHPRRPNSCVGQIVS